MSSGLGTALVGIGIVGAVIGGAVWGVDKLLDKADDALDEYSNNFETKLREQPLTTPHERLDAAKDVRGRTSDDTTIATVLIRAFDANNDGQVTKSEWRIQAGSDALDGSRLFDVADRFGNDGRADGYTTVDDVKAVLGHFGPSERLNGREDADHALARPLFVENNGRVKSKSIERATNLVLSRYDANGDGSINIKTEGSYKHGEFSAKPTHALDLADIDGDGTVTFRELRANLTSFDTTKQGQWEVFPGRNGVLDGNDYRDGKLIDF